MRSLEKAPKPKKQQKQKVVEEPEIMEELPVGTTVINVPITVAGFCEQLELSTATVIMKLMKLGIMANINQNIDEDTVLILADELGVDVAIGKVEDDTVEEGIENFEDKEEELKPRAPIVTVMGHVDHGKTSLLDAIRKTNVTASESGGITQHIGASEVTINGNKIVFLDTPGHEAFTAMRARGAHGADIAILVVAADDSVKPQTVESISHAKAAGVPIIVAINKIDKPGANPDRVKQDLTEHGILVEDWGGDTIAVPVSAKSGEGIVNLLEMVLLQAEVMELKANPNRLAMGTVIEARLDKAKGPVATLLVTNGTLQSGMSVVAGTSSGRIRLMTDFKGDTIRKAGPSTAVEILGLTDVPQAGDMFNAVKEDKVAREIAESRKAKLREEVLAKNASTTLEQLFSQIQEGEVKELNLIIKGDVQGSVGAIEASLEKLKNENVRVKIIHTGVGTVNESDVMLAETSGAIIIGFNVRPSSSVTAMAERSGVEIRTYRVIYDIIDDVENAMKGMLEPEFKEEVLGKVEVRTTFKVPGVGTVAGAYVLEGKVVRNAEIRLVRDGIVYHEGKISSLKRFKDDAREVQHGFECGIGFENYNDLKEGDIIECFQMVEVERK
ncbi:MAG: translation initiation factor IF-2 [Anaerovoracaceae bacterium]